MLCDFGASASLLSPVRAAKRAIRLTAETDFLVLPETVWVGSV